MKMWMRRFVIGDFEELTPRPPLQWRGGASTLGIFIKKAKGEVTPSLLERGPGG